MSEEPPANTLVLQDYYETFSLPVKSAVYCVNDGGRFSLSLETEVDPQLGQAVFTFERCRLEGKLAPGQTLAILYPQEDRESFDEASTHLLFGAHHSPRETVLTVTAMTLESIEVSGHFLWNENYVPDAGKMRYALGHFRAECRRGKHEELRVLM